MLTMSYGATVEATVRNVEALTIPLEEKVGPAPMISVTVPVGTEQLEAPWGLQTPSFTTELAVENGRLVSAVDGFVMVKMMVEALATLATTLASATIAFDFTIPAMVCWVGS